MTGDGRSTLRVLLADDEPLARQLLKELLEPHNEMEVVAEAADGVEAAELLGSLDIDVVFLDIRMPGLNGFGVLRSLPADRQLQVVFATAYDHYAVDAFEVAAVDYLLKPYEPRRLATTVERLRQRQGQLHRQMAGETAESPRAVAGRDDMLDILERLDRPSRYADRLFLKRGERTVVVQVRDIRRLQADRKQVEVHAGRRVIKVRDSLKRLEGELDPDHFVRVNRSTIVHVEHVVEIQPWFHGEWVLLLDDGGQIPTTRTYRHRIGGILGRHLSGEGRGPSS